MSTHGTQIGGEVSPGGPPERFLLLCREPGMCALADQLIRTGMRSDPVLIHTSSLSAALPELTDHGAAVVLAAIDGADGPQEIEALHAAAPWAAIIALLAGEDRELAIRAVRAGAQDCLVAA